MGQAGGKIHEYEAGLREVLKEYATNFTNLLHEIRGVWFSLSGQQNPAYFTFRIVHPIRQLSSNTILGHRAGLNGSQVNPGRLGLPVRRNWLRSQPSSPQRHCRFRLTWTIPSSEAWRCLGLRDRRKSARQILLIALHRVHLPPTVLKRDGTDPLSRAFTSARRCKRMLDAPWLEFES